MQNACRRQPHDQDHRTILSGMLWVARTGVAWRDLPAHVGSWKTVRSRYHRWCTAGIWQPILAALHQDDAPAPL